MKEEKDQDHHEEIEQDVPVVHMEESPEAETVPDGGWGWMCVLGSAIGQMLFGIIVRAFGVIYLALLDRYGASATATAWVGAINFAGTGFLGPVTSILCRRFNCRIVTIAGGLMIAIGVVATGWAPNIYITYITFGFIAGIGFSLSHVPGFLIISEYFDKRKALAMSIASFSSGIGALIGPPILIFLFDEYAYSGTFLIVGAICLNYCVAGALYRPLPTLKSKESTPNTQQEEHNSLQGDYDLKSTKEQEEIEVQLKEEAQTSLINDYQKSPTVKDSSECGKVQSEDKSTQHLPLTQSSDGADKGENRTLKEKKGIMARYSKLLKSPSFLALSFVILSLSFSLGLTSGFLPALAVDNGVSKSDAALLLSISGIASIISTLVLGPLLDIRAVRNYRLHVYNFTNLVTAITVFLCGVVTSYPAYATLTAILSAAAGVLMSQRATVIGDIVGRTSDAEGFGVVMMIGAIGSLFGRSLAGTIKDILGEYNGAFYLAGGITFLSVLIFEAALIRGKIVLAKKEENVTEA